MEEEGKDFFVNKILYNLINTLFKYVSSCKFRNKESILFYFITISDLLNRFILDETKLNKMLNIDISNTPLMDKINIIREFGKNFKDIQHTILLFQGIRNSIVHDLYIKRKYNENMIIDELFWGIFRNDSSKIKMEKQRNLLKSNCVISSIPAFKLYENSKKMNIGFNKDIESIFGDINKPFIILNMKDIIEFIETYVLIMNELENGNRFGTMEYESKNFYKVIYDIGKDIIKIYNNSKNERDLLLLKKGIFSEFVGIILFKLLIISECAYQLLKIQENQNNIYLLKLYLIRNNLGHLGFYQQFTEGGNLETYDEFVKRELDIPYEEHFNKNTDMNSLYKLKKDRDNMLKELHKFQDQIDEYEKEISRNSSAKNISKIYKKIKKLQDYVDRINLNLNSSNKLKSLDLQRNLINTTLIIGFIENDLSDLLINIENILN